MSITIKDAFDRDVTLKTTTEGGDEVLNTVGSESVSLAIGKSGPHEIIGTDEQVDINKYAASFSVDLAGTYSGEIFQFIMTSTGGDTIKPSGNLIVFDEDPSVSLNDSSVLEANQIHEIGHISVSTYDWISDGNGARVCINKDPIMFHPLSTLYFTWQHTYDLSYNDDSGDDEQLRMRFWYRRDT